MPKTMTLKEMFGNELPLNRKERFYTGTVFPMIVCRDNFQYFYVFTSLIKGCDRLDVAVDPRASNIEFFTEYSLLESVFADHDKKRFQNLPTTKDTPDIMILITGESKTLITIEAKMFDAPDSLSLKSQMDNQKKHVSYLKDKLNISHAFQLALIPGRLKVAENGFILNSDYQVITWEEIRERYGEIEDYKNDYFLGILDLALLSYDQLVCHTWGTSKNGELKLSGINILRNYKSVDFGMKIMGRKGGLNGPELNQDIQTGGWKTQKYETSSADNLPNQNWFYIDRFVERIDQIKNP